MLAKFLRREHHKPFQCTLGFIGHGTSQVRKLQWRTVRPYPGVGVLGTVGLLTISTRLTPIDGLPSGLYSIKTIGRHPWVFETAPAVANKPRFASTGVALTGGKAAGGIGAAANRMVHEHLWTPGSQWSEKLHPSGRPGHDDGRSVPSYCGCPCLSPR